jgi:hypothetical protein
MKYAGLTDEPAIRKQEHGNLSDFKVMQQFSSDVWSLPLRFSTKRSEGVSATLRRFASTMEKQDAGTGI